MKNKNKTRAEMRVEIANDVLRSLESRRYKAKHLVYVEAPSRDRKYQKQLNIIASWENSEEDEKRQFTTPEKCNVCALGAMFVSAVDRHNSVTLAEMSYLDGEAEYDYLSKWFSTKQLSLIESTFENQEFGNRLMEEHDYRSTELMHAAILKNFKEDKKKFKLKSYVKLCMSSPEYVMRSIMYNIIDNNGRFRPSGNVPLLSSRKKSWR